MSHDYGKIIALPPEVAAKIKSSTTIPSLTSVVIGLVENALDANALKIEVTVDYAKGCCTVEDDGHGITPNDFKEDGGLGKGFRKDTGTVTSVPLTGDRHVKIWP